MILMRYQFILIYRCFINKECRENKKLQNITTSIYERDEHFDTWNVQQQQKENLSVISESALPNSDRMWLLL